MSTPISLSDVQTLMASQEMVNAARHTELLGRFDALEARVRAREIEAAENRPVIRGWKGAAALIAASLVTGYIGSLFAQYAQ